MEEQPVVSQPSDTDALPEQMRVRHEKLERMQAAGVEGYLVGWPRTASIAQIRDEYADLATDTASGQVASVAGRVVLRRDGGKLCFATLRDGSGDIQIMLSLDKVGEERLADWKALVDLGDHVGVTGEVISSKRGELSILATEWAITSKALRPLPDKHHGLADPEARVRQRYVDLIVNPTSREIAQLRAQVVRSIRDSYHARDYIEVETPTLQAIHGGAAARPFNTHVNALDLDVSLRIALELPLKKLVVGGLERVFEIGKTFRNEGIDSTHFVEFTMLESYEAYSDYNGMAELTRDLVVSAARDVGRTVVDDGNGGQIDLEAPWRSATLHGLVAEAVGESIDPDTSIERLRALADKHEVELQAGWGAGEIVLELFEKLVEHTLLTPTFVRDYPESVRPLARTHRTDPRLTEAWDLVIAGTELAAAYSELVDPVVQRRRLTEQSLLAAGGDPEAMQLDEDFLRALEHGAPPMGGMGLGVDRLVMLLTGVGIRETILFPLVRPEQP
ncbi:MAG: lysyl-tRNA synthetase, class [Frankiaceae bacterium]|nr:lysyl-tRNA synthetase, class [Frankiaceae bacterium]